MELNSGSRLGHYEIADRLGKGGMGEVYRARDTKLNRDVALKVLPADLAGDADRRMRFEREAQAVAALNHPNIVTIHSVEQIAPSTSSGRAPSASSGQATHFITMELVEGRTLTQMIPAAGIPLEQMFEIAVPLADALAAAHEKGITHRDLKPDNVMVTGEGRVKVLDFGLAKLAESMDAVGEAGAATVTAEGKILGTIAYMSPEQAEGKTVDARSDVFSLGVLLYEMASGTRPFEGDTRISTITSILRDTPASLSDVKQDLPRHLARVVSHCMAKDPDRRYQSAKDVRNQLDELRREVESGEIEMSSVHSGISPAPAIRAASAGRRIGPILGLVAITALVVVTAVWFLTREAPAPLAALDAGVREGPVAVLGFENLGDPADAEQFSHMLVGLITTGLADSGGIEVVSSAKVRTSLKQAGAAATGFDPTFAAAAARLAGAGTMVLGQVIPGDRKLLLTAELVDVSSGNTLGSMRAEGRDKSDLFVMAGEIAAEVLGRLATGGVEEGLAIDLAKSLTDSTEAYGHYAAGQLALHERRFVEAIEELSEAVRLDPTFALAYYELGMAQLWHGERAGALRNLHVGLQYVDRLPPRWQITYQAVIDYEAGNADLAYAALEELLAQSPQMPDPYNYLGEILTHYSKYQDFFRGIELFEQALELDPTYKVVLFHLHQFLLSYDRLDEVQALLDRYGDDNDPSVLAMRVALLYYQRRFSEVVELEQDPAYAERIRHLASFRTSLLRTGAVDRALELSRQQVGESVGYSKGIDLLFDALLNLRAARFRQAIENLNLGPPLFDSPVVHALGAGTLVVHARVNELLGNIEGAIERAHAAREVDYFHAESRFETARLLYAAGRLEEGDREVQGLELLAQDSHSPYTACWGEIARAERHRAHGDSVAALSMLRGTEIEVCRPATSDPRAIVQARAAEDSGDLAQALEHFRAVADPSKRDDPFGFDPSIAALYEVARLEQRLGKNDEARRHYREFLDIWGNADMTVPIVEQARAQLAALE